MERVTKRSNNLVLAGASTTCLVRFAYPIVQYMGSSNGIRAVCVGVARTVAENVTIVRVLPYVPDDCSDADGQKKLTGILMKRPRMTTLDISQCLLEEDYVSFGWILYKTFPQLNTLLMLGDRNAIITNGHITDFYASFRPTSFLTKEAVIEVVLLALPQEDFTTLQNFCNNPHSHGKLCFLASNADSYVCKYIQKEADDRNTVECCFHVKSYSRQYFRLTLAKNDGVWTIYEVETFNAYNFCEICKI